MFDFIEILTVKQFYDVENVTGSVDFSLAMTYISWRSWQEIAVISRLFDVDAAL